jgi:hypothetical protein
VQPTSLEVAADRLARLLLRPGDFLAEPGRHDLEFERDLAVRPLERGIAPADTWAIDGGQGMVLDARCLQVVVTRAARVRYAGGACLLEEEGPLNVSLLGGGESRAAVAALDLGVAPDAGLEGVIHLLRDGAEWQAVRRSVGECEPDGMVLVDGDLQPDWRVPSTFVAAVLAEARDRHVTLAGVTKHTSLSRGGAPLMGMLELEAERTLGPDAMWWAPVAHTRPDLSAEGAGLQVVAARLDPQARYAFRIDLPADVEAEPALRRLSALSDDAAFPGYPYPLTVADRLAACPRWVCDDVRSLIDERFDLAGVPLDVRERSFADRHRMMERS